MIQNENRQSNNVTETGAASVVTPPSSLPIIGLTGITGSGTSTVAGILAHHGGFVCHADKLAHEVMVSSGTAYGEIVNAFGNDVLNANGEISRRALGAKVFGNREKLAKLEKIIHPLVIIRIKELIAEVSYMARYTFAVIDAPLLIESGLEGMCDSCWLITAPNNIRLERIMTRDDLDADAATRRLKSRAGDDALRPYANIIIENGGSEVALRSKTLMALKALKNGRHGWRGMEVLEI